MGPKVTRIVVSTRRSPATSFFTTRFIVGAPAKFYAETKLMTNFSGELFSHDKNINTETRVPHIYINSFIVHKVWDKKNFDIYSKKLDNFTLAKIVLQKPFSRINLVFFTAGM